MINASIKNFWKNQKTNFLFIILFIISITSFVFSLQDFRCDFLKLTSEELTNIFGAIVSATALVVTVYIVIIDISVSYKNRQIERRTTIASRQLAEIKEKYDEVKEKDIEIRKLYGAVKAMSDLSEKTFLSFSEKALKIVNDNHVDEKTQNDFLLWRARIAFSQPNLDPETRKSLLLPLAVVGQKEDISELRIIISNEDEPSDIRGLAHALVALIENKANTDN